MTAIKPRLTYTDEFKNQLVQLYFNRKRKCDMIREYHITASLLDKQIKQTQTTGSKKDNHFDLENELIELHKRNYQLEMKNDILNQAALIR